MTGKEGGARTVAGRGPLAALRRPAKTLASKTLASKTLATKSLAAATLASTTFAAKTRRRGNADARQRHHPPARRLRPVDAGSNQNWRYAIGDRVGCGDQA